MKLKSVATYQVVLFQGKNHTFFTEKAELGLKDMEIEYMPGLHAIRIKSPKDDILVFVTNVAYAVPADAQDLPLGELHRGKLKNIDSSAKIK